MCDSHQEQKRGWKGWSDAPPPGALTGVGAWIDLTHTVTEDLSRSPVFPKPSIRQIMRIPEGPANITEIHMVTHYGTHVDAPRHFFNDGPSFDEIPLERLYGPGVCWRIEKGEFGVIDVDDLERATPAVRPGDIVLLDTGWAQYMQTEKYDRHPSLSPAGANWLVGRKVKLLAIDCHTPDLSTQRRQPGFGWPVHDILLTRGILVAEHLTNLRELANQRVEALFLALSIKGSDGGPARVLARAAN